MFVHESVSFKLRDSLSINFDNIHFLSIEISNIKSKNIILNTIYRPPNGNIKQFKTHFKDIFSKNGKNLKYYSACRKILDITLLFRFWSKSNSENLSKTWFAIFCYKIILLKNKPTRETRHLSNVIDHTINNSAIDHNYINSVIIKTREIISLLSLHLKPTKNKKASCNIYLQTLLFWKKYRKIQKYSVQQKLGWEINWRTCHLWQVVPKNQS